MRLIFAAALTLLPTLAAAGPIRAGEWELVTRVTDIHMEGAPPGLAAMMKGRPTTIRHCITEADAAKGPRELMAGNGMCKLISYDMAGGHFSSSVVCERPGMKTSVTSSGSFTSTSFAATGRSVTTGAHSASTSSSISGRRVGDCH